MQRRGQLGARGGAGRAQELLVQASVVLAVRALAVFVDQHLGDPLLRLRIGRPAQELLEVEREHPDQRVVLQAEDLVVLARERDVRDPGQQRVVHAGVALDLLPQLGEERARGAHVTPPATTGSRRGAGRAGTIASGAMMPISSRRWLSPLSRMARYRFILWTKRVMPGIAPRKNPGRRFAAAHTARRKPGRVAW